MHLTSQQSTQFHWINDLTRMNADNQCQLREVGCLNWPVQLGLKVSCRSVHFVPADHRQRSWASRNCRPRVEQTTLQNLRASTSLEDNEDIILVKNANISVAVQINAGGGALHSVARPPSFLYIMRGSNNKGTVTGDDGRQSEMQTKDSKYSAGKPQA